MSSDAFNLARRHSVRNENDLLQEDFFAEEQLPDYTEKMCNMLLEKVSTDSPLPKQCQNYPSVMSNLQRMNSDRSKHAIAFAGMSPGDATAAMAARKNGQLSHAQFQRRLTHRHHGGKW